MLRVRRKRTKRCWTAVLALAGVSLGVAAIALGAPEWSQRLVVPLEYEEQIASSAARHGVDPYLVAAVISAESGFDAGGVSSKGAVGLMQLMPETAAEQAAVTGRSPVGPEDLTDPATNIELGTGYLARLLRRYGDERAAIAAYNAGMGVTDRWITEGPVEDTVAFPETREFLRRVLAERDRYRELFPDAFAGMAAS